MIHQVSQRVRRSRPVSCSVQPPPLPERLWITTNQFATKERSYLIFGLGSEKIFSLESAPNKGIFGIEMDTEGSGHQFIVTYLYPTYSWNTAFGTHPNNALQTPKQQQDDDPDFFTTQDNEYQGPASSRDHQYAMPTSSRPSFVLPTPHQPQRRPNTLALPLSLPSSLSLSLSRTIRTARHVAYTIALDFILDNNQWLHPRIVSTTSLVPTEFAKPNARCSGVPRSSDDVPRHSTRHSRVDHYQ
jgi:hypothetical protein